MTEQINLLPDVPPLGGRMLAIQQSNAQASINAREIAVAITTYLVEVGVHEISDQISAIRRYYPVTWRATLIRHGFDVATTVSVMDISEGIGLALTWLLDAEISELTTER